MPSFPQTLINLILAPTRGWEDVAGMSGIDSRRMLVRGLLPLTAAAGLSVFARPLYVSGLTFGMLLISAIVVSVKFFLAYYIALFLFSIFLPPMTQSGFTAETDNRTAAFTALNLALLAIIEILSNLLPVELSIVQFLPVYVAVIIWQGRNFMDIEPSRAGHFILLALLAIIAPVYILGLMFKLFIP